MIEIPEAALLARQVTQTLGGKVVQSAAAGQSPHKFAWLSGDSDYYARALTGRAIEDAVPRGGMRSMILILLNVSSRYFCR